ncbi:MAG: LLM class flavin-dependent oxidoreductase, partial [Chloroflexi bacterium]
MATSTNASARSHPSPQPSPRGRGSLSCRLGLALANEGPVAETVALAVEAERLGLSEVWLPESGHGRGVFTVAATLAAATR